MENRNPACGARWLTPDPVGGDVTNPQSLNRYAYVRNNPTTLVDPLGLLYGPPPPPPRQPDITGQWLEAMLASIPPGQCLTLSEGPGGGQTFCNGPQSNLSLASLRSGGGGGTPPPCKNKQQVINLRIDEVFRSLLSDPQCLAFLQSAGVKLPGQFSAGLTDDPTVSGAGTAITMKSVGVGPESSTTVIGASGGFFNGARRFYGAQDIAAGTPWGQALILLHELGHGMWVLPADPTPDTQGANNQTVKEHCKTTLGNFRNR